MLPEPPRRLQRRRTRGAHLPPGTVCVTRPSRWGNPFPVATYGREESLRLFRAYLAALPQEELLALLRPLQGKHVACYCRLSDACHADVWLELVRTHLETG